MLPHPLPARRWLPAFTLPVLLGLAGCGGDSSLARTFGLVRDAPDEFLVTTQAPLSMPPDYNLRPPRPGAPRPQQRSERQQAEEALVPQLALTGPPAGAPSRGQTALLEESGPAPPPNVRQLVDQDAKLEQASDSFLDKVLFWRKPDLNTVEVDPEREKQRLQQNSALGQPPDTGATPTIAPRRRSWFERLFGWL